MKETSLPFCILSIRVHSISSSFRLLIIRFYCPTIICRTSATSSAFKSCTMHLVQSLLAALCSLAVTHALPKELNGQERPAVVDDLTGCSENYDGQFALGYEPRGHVETVRDEGARHSATEATKGLRLDAVLQYFVMKLTDFCTF